VDTPADDSSLLIDPKDGSHLRRQGAVYVSASRSFQVEDGVVRMLGEVDPDLARELEAQDNAVDEYRDPALLMPRYERDMARLALVELFGGSPPRGAILDAGCGIGILGRLYPELALVGLDASMTLIREASTGYSLRVEASAEALPFAAGTFDVVVALNMLHHVINPDQAVREFARVLKPGGTLVTVDPRKVGVIELAKQVLRGNDTAFAPTHKAFGVSEYESLIAQGGLFRVERQERVGLLTLVTMGGFDALKLSRFVPNPELFADVLRGADQRLFELPGVSRAGLNLAIRATKS
jgi:SAM-dependent methyltransferase